ncbi:MAG TPA: metallophosphoesterase [Thermoanaerobaculia bacterium]|nr:metallophosphoesterase [Thermoanaerobaculia bacterium]
MKRAPMTAWYDPFQLLRHAPEVLAASIFGQRADTRLIEALAAPQATLIDCSREEDGTPIGEFWMDFVADSGDGFNSTYAVASAVAQPSLELRDSVGVQHTTRRGRILVFGGDQVYPTASRERYKEKLVEPWRTALAFTGPPHPSAFAIPGNHDWYDSLVAFSRLFFSRDWFGGWRTPQRRSYFALKLPHRWWVIGTDVQLGSDIDAPQVEFFERVAREMDPEDRIILCTAEPHWIYTHIYGKYDTSGYTKSSLRFLEEKVFATPSQPNGRVAVFLSGDLHHYRRHEASDHRQKITAGGGGASLHPTHGPDVSMLEGGYRLTTCFPEQGTSKALCWRNLLFFAINPTFGFLTAFLYLLTAWAVSADIGRFGLSQLGEAVTTTLHEVVNKPNAGFWVIAILLLFFLFTDTHSPAYRIFGGLLHGLAHLVALFFIAWGAAACLVARHFEPGSFAFVWRFALSVAAGGWLAGSLIMGIYLLVSLNVFQRHSDEAFASLRIQDFKQFLRLRIGSDGNLTIFPIGIRRVPRRWKEAPAGTGGPGLLPDDSNATAPALIEDPIPAGRAPQG